MYIEILGGKGKGSLEEVDVIFHKGILHNKRFSVKPAAILPLIWNKQIPVTDEDLRKSKDQLLVKECKNDPNTFKFLDYLNQLSTG